MKKLSSMVSTTILYAGGGAGWTALGLLRLFGADANLDVLEYILLITGAAVAIIFMLPKRDTFDEMAQAHLMNALSWGFVADDSGNNFAGCQYCGERSAVYTDLSNHDRGRLYGCGS